MKKILITSMHFYPENFRINDIAFELKKMGYDVYVVTGIPNYPGGRFYEGYRFPDVLFNRLKEEWNGIKIRRLIIFPRGLSRFTLSLNYISYIISGFFWSKNEKEKFDVIFVFATSPIFQALPAIWYAKKRQLPVYIYVQDLWPDSLVVAANVKNKFIISIIDKIVNYIYKNSTKILVTSKSMLETLLQRNVPKEKLIYLPQYAEEFYKPMEKKTIPEIDGKKFNITYTGNVGYAQGLDILPKSAKILKDKKINSIVFNIVGDGRYKQELIELTKMYGVQDMFNFIGLVPAKRIPEILASSDIALLSYKSDELLSKYIPAKLQTYMACGKPILAIADGETKKIIEEAQCGISVPPGEPDKLADTIINLVNMEKNQISKLGQFARKYYEEYFDKKEIIKKLEQTLFDKKD